VLGCEILARVAQVVVYGVAVVSGGINKRRSTIGIAKTTVLN
jgi:hypothetical protein